MAPNNCTGAQVQMICCMLHMLSLHYPEIVVTDLDSDLAIMALVLIAIDPTADSNMASHCFLGEYDDITDVATQARAKRFLSSQGICSAM